ncbi:MAG: hypothetical protein NT027_02070 [Proteobacteria bacterium]|nr:hypothetical protein [Pseudomonadota bacterium]
MTVKSKKPFLKYSFGLQLSLMVLLGVFVTAILSFWTAVPVLESLANLAYDDRQVNLMSEARLRIAELYKLRRDVLENKIHDCLKSSTNLNLCSIHFQNHTYNFRHSNQNLRNNDVNDLIQWTSEDQINISNELGAWTLKLETPPIKELGNSISEWVSARSHLILVVESLKKSLIVNLAKSITVGGLVALLIVSLFSKSTRRRFSELRRFIRTLSLGGQQDIPAPLMGNDDFSVLASDVHSLSKSLAEAQKKLIDVERMNLWQNMARKVAHEIKNPMTPMSLVGEQLKLISSSIGDPKLNHIISESGRIICEETASLNRMVKEFTAFARLPKPQMERAKMSVLIKDILRPGNDSANFS